MALDLFKGLFTQSFVAAENLPDAGAPSGNQISSALPTPTPLESPLSVPCQPSQGLSSLNTPTTNHSITMAAGRCTKPFCGCPKGIFDVPLAGNVPVDGVPCRHCEHQLAHHKAYESKESPSIPPVVPDKDALLSCLAELPADTLPRQHLVDQVILRANVYKFVVVRGTPATGKTTLSLLVANSLFRSQSLPVYLLLGWPKDEVKAAGGWKSYLEELTGIHGRSWLAHEAYLLIDEAQESYWDSELWVALFKAISGANRGPRVITFSSFGSPSGGYQGINQTKRFIKTSLTLGIEQKISLPALPLRVQKAYGVEPVGLLFDRSEAEMVIDSLVKSYNRRQFPADLQEQIYHITAGHPGALTSLVQRMFTSCPRLHTILRFGGLIDLQTANENLFSRPKELFDILRDAPFARGLPSPEALQNTNYSPILKKMVVRGGRCKQDDLGAFAIADIEKLVENGWVHTETPTNGEIEYSFASPLHFWHCASCLLPSVPAGKLAYGSPLELAIEAIKGFYPSQLSGPGRSYYGGRTTGIAFEDQFQKELYRCLLPLLDGSVYVSPEYVVKGGGRVDFQLEEQCWALELLREGNSNTLKKHCARFLKGGKYHSMIKEGNTKKFAVLNFTTSLPKHPLQDMTGILYHVLFTENFRKVDIIDGGTHQTVTDFVLLESL
ncbi:hypothetical protein FN846DRAFT_980288 [Sphaerosporella brunnea]|uniref:Uncharacterized protein n=1 Tax=Sphaerosporella brunnea TaxID=1250544 RepID=A0A5J5ED26_9PEZI|nr:hypothetical protein FN846DRAFT_980288 [Sphaerosporella brunnea]